MKSKFIELQYKIYVENLDFHPYRIRLVVSDQNYVFTCAVIKGKGKFDSSLIDDFFKQQKSDSIWQLFADNPSENSCRSVEIYVKISKDRKRTEAKIIVPFNDEKIVVGAMSENLLEGMTEDEIVTYFSKKKHLFRLFVEKREKVLGRKERSCKPVVNNHEWSNDSYMCAIEYEGNSVEVFGEHKVKGLWKFLRSKEFRFKVSPDSTPDEIMAKAAEKDPIFKVFLQFSKIWKDV